MRLGRISKLVLNVGLSAEGRSRFKIFRLLVYLVLIIHWITCFFYVITLGNYEILMKKINSEPESSSLFYLDENGKR